MGTSKKALLASRPNATKLLFDEDGTSREIYSLIGEKEFLEDGDAMAQKKEFLEREGEKMGLVDEGDKKREKEKRREKKRKGVREEEVSISKKKSRM